MSHPAFRIKSINPYHIMLLTLGIALFAVLQIGVYWGGISLCFSVLVYLTYRQYLDDVERRAKQTAPGVNDIEHSENYVRQLEQHVSTLEKNAAALRETHEKFRREASHDPLTGLPNRKMIVETLEHLL